MAARSGKCTAPRLPLRTRDRQALAEIFKDFDGEQIRQIDTILNHSVIPELNEEAGWLLGSAAVMA